MKKIALVINISLLAIVFFACKQNKPEPVVEKYYTHFYRAEFEEIKNYVMEEHRSYYELLKQLVSSENDTTQKPEIKVTDIKCDIKGDTVAICSCFVQEGDQEGKEQVVQLKKVNKHWLVNQGKEGNAFPSNEEMDEITDNPISYEEASEDVSEEEGVIIEQ